MQFNRVDNGIFSLSTLSRVQLRGLAIDMGAQVNDDALTGIT
jgi:hypothetical protein